MPDTLATNLTQLKSSTRKDHCDFPPNKQSCCLKILKAKNLENFTAALSEVQGVRSPGTVLQNAVALRTSSDGLLFAF